MYGPGFPPLMAFQPLLTMFLGFAASLMFMLLLGFVLFYRSWAVPPEPRIAPPPEEEIPLPTLPAPEKEGRAPAPSLAPVPAMV